MPYVEFGNSQELTTIGKLYFPEKIQTHFCRKCGSKFTNHSTITHKSRLCTDCMMDHYVENHGIDEF